MNTPSIQLNSGYSIPMLGIGTWKGSPPRGQHEEVRIALEYAIECGYRHIDCAFIYENEEGVGNAIRNKIEDKTIKRENIFVTNKLWNTFHKSKDVKPALMTSLNNLKLKYIDLYLMHWPFSFANLGEVYPLDKDGNVIFDDVDYVETWKAMEELKKEGLVRSIGVSNFNEYQINRIVEECDVPPAVNQIELHPFFQQTELVQFCKEKGIAVTSFASLGSPSRGWASEDHPFVLENPILMEIAANINKTVAQVVLRYQIEKGIIVIPKSVTPNRIKSNSQIFDFRLTKEQMQIIDSLNKSCNIRCFGFKIASKHRFHPFADNYTE